MKYQFPYRFRISVLYENKLHITSTFVANMFSNFMNNIVIVIAILRIFQLHLDHKQLKKKEFLKGTLNSKYLINSYNLKWGSRKPINI